ncbi:MAG: murein L,D-transpeptidase YcbB/YkuD, partial [Bacteroidia bacterium]
KSGPANALGKVKFIFPNKYSIYLHDTPQKSKFKWSGRAVSHGCVRVENPLLLGEFLTQKIDTLDADDFRIHMGYEPQNEERLKDYDAEDTTTRIQPLTETRIIRLNEQLPVFFLYNTIFFDEDWNVQYRNDVYDKNKFIIEGMNF